MSTLNSNYSWEYTKKGLRSGLRIIVICPAPGRAFVVVFSAFAVFAFVDSHVLLRHFFNCCIGRLGSFCCSFLARVSFLLSVQHVPLPDLPSSDRTRLGSSTAS